MKGIGSSSQSLLRSLFFLLPPVGFGTSEGEEEEEEEEEKEGERELHDGTTTGVVSCEIEGGVSTGLAGVIFETGGIGTGNTLLNLEGELFTTRGREFDLLNFWFLWTFCNVF